MIRLHNQNRTHTFIDVESGQFISLPKDETDKPPVNADVNGLMIYGKTTQDGEPAPDNPVDLVSPSEFNLTVCGKNLYDIDAAVGNAMTKEGDIFTITRKSEGSTISYRGSLQVPINIPAGVPFTVSYCLIEKTISGSWGLYGRKKNRTYLDTYIHASQPGYVSKTMVLDSPLENLLLFIRAEELAGTYVKFKDFQIEVGEQRTSHVSYIAGSTHYRIEDLDGNLHELCSLPDGTRDEYDRDNGILIKKVKSIQITNSSVFSYYSRTETIASIVFVDNANKWPNTVWANTNMRCNIVYPFDSNIANTCYFDRRTTNTELAIRVNKSELSSQDGAGARAWAANIISQAGYIEFEYPYSEPQIIPIKRYGETYGGVVWEYNEKPKSIQYHTNIFTDKNIDMQCEVRKLGNRAMGTFNWVTENGDKIITEDEDYIMFEY